MSSENQHRTIIFRENEHSEQLYKNDYSALLDLKNNHDKHIFHHHSKYTVKPNINMVGAVTLPSGMCVEVLPKVGDSNEEARTLLQEIISIYLSAKKINITKEKISPESANIIDYFVYLFLGECAQVVRGGLARQYRNYEEAHYFIRGKINFRRQAVRALAIPVHLKFQKFEVDRPENRLLKQTLQKILSMSASDKEITRENRTRALKLLPYFEEVSSLTNIAKDFRLWSRSRSLSHYGSSRFLCEVILREYFPSLIPKHTQKNTFSIFFSMDELFELFIAYHLRKQGIKVSDQKHLSPFMKICNENDSNSEPFFSPQPDFKLSTAESKQEIIADAKWKFHEPESEHHGLKRGDIYQIFAYLNASNVSNYGLLIYPQTEKFKVAQHFQYTYGAGNKKLTAVPFDCRNPETSAREIKEQLGSGAA